SFQHYFLFGSSNDVPLMGILKSEAQDPASVTLVTPSSFRALGAHLLLVDGVVAVDSGPLHLARALGVPSLGFLSGGDSKRWFPPTERKSDLLLRRGLFSRYPSAFEMGRAFRRWERVFSTSTR